MYSLVSMCVGLFHQNIKCFSVSKRKKEVKKFTRDVYVFTRQCMNRRIRQHLIPLTVSF